MSLPKAPRFAPLPACANVVASGLLSLVLLWLSPTLLIVGISTVPALGSGIFLILLWVLMMRAIIPAERMRAVAVHRLTLHVPPMQRSTLTGLPGLAHTLALDVMSWWFWRGVLHHHLKLILGALGSGLSLFCLLVAWEFGDAAWHQTHVSIFGYGMATTSLALTAIAAMLLSVIFLCIAAFGDRQLDRAMLPGTEAEWLRHEVADLTRQRQGAVDAAEEERLRIERDLHDGVQPRLVALAMTLGMATAKIDTDPAAAKALLQEGHREAKATITDLRELVRGIHPAVLTDRGLDAALSAVAARSPVPCELVVDLPTRVGREQEAVAYFVVSEALTNIAKHSSAQRAQVYVRWLPDPGHNHADNQRNMSEARRRAENPQDCFPGPRYGTVEVVVCDDGQGGAQMYPDGPSTGLRGLTSRVAAAGGTLRIDSPPGGPTRLIAFVPASISTSPRAESASPAHTDDGTHHSQERPA
ncbi:sensor histidine kinase [Devriesea agamarum]|uniref:sensor histidine kinase n=1 Tax=Devriesea agamarum TaxID=472569 RepID=UPI00071E1433|nr:histidine kinase [Devriesea agamarum]